MMKLKPIHGPFMAVDWETEQAYSPALRACTRPQNTVKPFNLVALKVGNFAYTIILAPFILAN